MCVMGLISWRSFVGLLTGRAPRRTGREPALNKGQLLLGLLLLRWSLAVVRVSLHLSSPLGACGWWGQGLPWLHLETLGRREEELFSVDSGSICGFELAQAAGKLAEQAGH